MRFCRKIRHAIDRFYVGIFAVVQEVTVRADTYAGKCVTIMGLGLFGGGVGAARFFARHGASVTVTDKRSAADLKPSMDALNGLPIRYVLGKHDIDDFRSADIVLVNPGVPSDSPLVTIARGAGAQIEHSINLLFKMTAKNPKLGVTGSNGKSTTTALLGEMLRLHDSRTLVGGNIGKCLLSEAERLPAGVPMVVELSSFMLEGMRELEQSPHVAIVTNLSPNHLDRHVTMEAYAAAKRNIIAFQTKDDFAILNADDPMLKDWHKHTRARVIRFSVKKELDGDAAFLDRGKLVLRMGNVEEVVAAASQALRDCRASTMLPTRWRRAVRRRCHSACVRGRSRRRWRHSPDFHTDSKWWREVPRRSLITTTPLRQLRSPRSVCAGFVRGSDPP